MKLKIFIYLMTLLNLIGLIGCSEAPDFEKKSSVPLTEPHMAVQAIGNRNVAVIMINFTDATLTSTPAEVDDAMFGATDSAQSFYT